MSQKDCFIGPGMHQGQRTMLDYLNLDCSYGWSDVRALVKLRK